MGANPLYEILDLRLIGRFYGLVIFLMPIRESHLWALRQVPGELFLDLRIVTILFSGLFPRRAIFIFIGDVAFLAPAAPHQLFSRSGIKSTNGRAIKNGGNSKQNRPSANFMNSCHFIFLRSCPAGTPA